MKPTEHIELYLNGVVKKAEDGHMNHLEALIKLRSMKFSLEKLIGIVDEFESNHLEKLASEADSWGGHFGGYDIQVRSGGKTFSFKHIAEWQKAQAQVKAIEAKYKSYYDAAQKGALMATEDGEEIEMPSIGYRKSSVVMKKVKS